MKPTMQLSSFSRILKNLQSDNISIPELRLLKQEHQYLEKLRHQRSKIEELKAKYDQNQQEKLFLIDKNRQYKCLIEQQGQTIELLQHQIQQQQNRRQQLQNDFVQHFQAEKQKQKSKIQENHYQVDQLKKILKKKELEIMGIEDENNQKITKLKQNWHNQKRKIINEYEQRIKLQINDRNQSESVQLRNLVSRLHKALSIQNQQYQSLLQKYTKLENENEKIQEQYEKYTNQNQLYQEKVAQLSQQIQQLTEKLNQYNQDTMTRGQLQQIRKKMNELTKGQIERIQFIVNDIQ